MSVREEFDYVVVGAGSAGCVLANRLTEDPKTTVCLIEAGGRDRSPLIHVPLFMIWLMNHKTLNWQYFTKPQPHAAGRKIHVPRGKTLGGSSSINGMVYIRGHPLDYDDWAAAGNAGWSFDDVLPYFLKAENNETLGDSPFHGSGGPLNVVDHAKPNPVNEAFIAAAEEMQIRRRRDFNDDGQEGVGYHQMTQKNGLRHSAAAAYLDPVRKRPNLKIVTGGQVARVMLDGKRATGIELAAANGAAARTISARKEIVLSAGAIGSPQILMLSGIGAPDELARVGIGVAHELPGVGKNLQDHFGTGVRYSSPGTATYGLSVQAIPKLLKHGIDFIFKRRGLLASNIIESCGFIKTDPGLDRPDIQYGFMPAKRGDAGRLLGYGHGYSLVTILLRPKGRGTVTLTSPDPSVKPEIDLVCFSQSEDLEAFMRGYKIARRMMESPAMAPYRGEELVPGPAVKTDDQLRDFLRQYIGTIYHPVGTCKMGPDSDPAAVVDNELKVRGIDGLRVADASIMPTIVGGNTNAPAIMIGEKCADMMRAAG